MLTQPGTNVAWDWPSPAVTKLTEDEDASNLATTVLVTSQGTTDTSGNQTPLCARADNPDLIGDGFPALWRIDASDHSSVTEQSTLDGYATAYAADYHDPLVEHPFTVRADDANHPLGSYSVGVTTQLTVHRDPWIKHDTYIQRIVDIAPSGNEVTLTVNAP